MTADHDELLPPAAVEMFDFLDGSKPMDGRWFGDPGPTNERGYRMDYWWRERLGQLRAHLAAQRKELSQLRVKTDMLERAVEQGQSTIKIGQGLLDSLSDEIRREGVEVTTDPIRVVNPHKARAERLEAALRLGLAIAEDGGTWSDLGRKESARFKEMARAVLAGGDQ